MPQPDYIRRANKRKPDLPVVDSDKPKPAKKKRVRPMAFKKRGELSYAEQASRRNVAEWAEAAAKQEARRIDEDALDVRRARQIEELYEKMRLLPIHEIDDSKLALYGRALRPQAYTDCVVVARFSGALRKVQREYEESTGIKIADKFFEIQHGQPFVQRRAGGLPGVDSLAMHTTMEEGGNGFKPTLHPMKNPAFNRRFKDGDDESRPITLLIIRGLDGCCTRLDYWKDFCVAQQYRKFLICFYLDNQAGFSPVFKLDDIVDERVSDERLVYLRRRWASLALARRFEADNEMMLGEYRQYFSEWTREYAQYETKGRNGVARLAQITSSGERASDIPDDPLPVADDVQSTASTNVSTTTPQLSRNKCTECGEPFKDAQSLEQHAKRNEHRTFVCPEPSCDKSYSRRDALARHRGTHKTMKTHVCAACAQNDVRKAFSRKDHLDQHIRNSHSST